MIPSYLLSMVPLWKHQYLPTFGPGNRPSWTSLYSVDLATLRYFDSSPFKKLLNCVHLKTQHIFRGCPIHRLIYYIEYLLIIIIPAENWLMQILHDEQVQKASVHKAKVIEIKRLWFDRWENYSYKLFRYVVRNFLFFGNIIPCDGISKKVNFCLC